MLVPLLQDQASLWLFPSTPSSTCNHARIPWMLLSELSATCIWCGVQNYQSIEIRKKNTYTTHMHANIQAHIHLLCNSLLHNIFSFIKLWYINPKFWVVAASFDPYLKYEKISLRKNINVDCDTQWGREKAEERKLKRAPKEGKGMINIELKRT